MRLGKEVFTVFVATVLVSCHRCVAAKDPDTTYGVDVSFPIHHKLSTNYAWLPHNVDPLNNPVPNKYKGMPIQVLPDRSEIYEEFMQGCRDHYGSKGHLCDQTEEDRLAMSFRQAQSMKNYTSTGFKKIRAPDSVMRLLSDHWEKNKDKKKEEKWGTGNTYVNYWKAPTYMASVEDRGLRGGGFKLKTKIWDAVKPTIEQWTGMELTPTSMYGIRVYTEGAILNPHVDRLPLVSSCIINVAQDVDEDWPLEVYDREGNAVNVTMKPGDMVLYESGSLLHGRPFPLKGKYYANIFIHFEPTGRRIDGGAAEENTEHDLPPYILSGSLEEEHWRMYNPGGWKNPSPSASQVELSEGHKAAAFGDIVGLEKLAKENRRLLHLKDKNGWQPIHEAARAGQKEVVQKLIGYGADFNQRTNRGKGGTPLYLAIKNQGKDHPLSQYLEGLGALNLGPEL